MGAGSPIFNLVQALATIANAFAQNLSGLNAPPSQMWSMSILSVCLLHLQYHRPAPVAQMLIRLLQM